MKIILSRKGFDSQNGKMPSPIMPDGTLLSLPIPSKEDSNKYTELMHNGRSYYDIIKDLNPRTVVKEKWNCHLDPDLRRDVLPRKKNWKPAFGQVDAAQTHLSNQEVGEGDLFLFFGWFRQTEEYEGKLRFVKNAPSLHIIFGYLYVGKVLKNSDDTTEISYHPHTHKRYGNRKDNSIYIATEALPLSNVLPGAGCLDYSSELVLTKDGMSRSKWKLPDFFKNVSISHHKSESFKDGYFQSVAIGQEFVIEANERVSQWAKSLLNQHSSLK